MRLASWVVRTNFSDYYIAAKFLDRWQQIAQALPKLSKHDPNPGFIIKSGMPPDTCWYLVSGPLFRCRQLCPYYCLAIGYGIGGIGASPIKCMLSLLVGVVIVCQVN